MRSKPKGEQLVNSFAGTFLHLPLPVFVGHSGSGRSVAPCILEIAHAKENPLEQGETHTHTHSHRLISQVPQRDGPTEVAAYVFRSLGDVACLSKAD